MPYRDVTVDEALELFRSGRGTFLDVRTGSEWLSGHIPGALHIPLDELSRRIEELDPGHVTVVVCSHGLRSATAGRWLHELGFDVANVRHGMCRWPGPLEFGISRGGTYSRKPTSTRPSSTRTG